MLQSKYDMNNQLVAFFSTEKYNILLQEILFEKHWNEVESSEYCEEQLNLLILNRLIIFEIK